jgi:hypothetical protein
VSDHLGDSNKLVCVHCGLPADRNQNGIQGYRCGSSYEPNFRPQWARSMTCLEIENRQLREMFRKANLQALDLADRLNRLEEAGDVMAEYLASGVDVDNWTAAKEAKP